VKIIKAAAETFNNLLPQLRNLAFLCVDEDAITKEDFGFLISYLPGLCVDLVCVCMCVCVYVCARVCVFVYV